MPCLNEVSKEVESAGAGMKNSILVFLMVLSCNSFLNSQTYPGAAGQAGSTAIHKDSSIFVAWATACTVQRGWQDISNTSLGPTTVGDSSMALGKALTNGVVSLGDGGKATCRFAKPISNGPGFDFAVFENSIDDSFLELAFVEVSSDGLNFFRFGSHSLTDTTSQTGSFGSTDPKKINNLAGKYRAGYGTPFDLQEITPNVLFDINSVTHVRIVDVVGSISNMYASRDSYSNKINDPWPTAFPSGGFDLDAVGVIHQNNSAGVSQHDALLESFVYPNPVDLNITPVLNISVPFLKAQLMDLHGRVLQEYTEYAPQIKLPPLSSGLYFLKLTTNGAPVLEKIQVH